MPSFKLDGKEIPFTPGETIIAAAHKVGIEIPNYCWHPGLSIAANCRMCLIEIESAPNFRPMMLDVLTWNADKKDYVVDRKPKLQPGCQQVAADGMVIKSETSHHVAEARAHVQEFLLLNHPVDCPICDQAGECKLQDYYMTAQHTPKRMVDEPVHKPKGVVFGDTIVYDAERCIACTRCIRFCDEIAGDHMLDMRERGNKFEIVLAPGRTLDGHYTMMTEWVCPVGALTTRYWRHKGRVWVLKGTKSVCPGCATGCNMWLDADPREQTAFRNRPRENDDVNKHWMCDDGMLTYLRVGNGRVLEASTGRGKDRTSVSVKEAVAKAATLLGKKGTLGVVLSAQASSEDNLVAAELARAAGAKLYLSARADWDGDKILRHKDQNPNRAGVVAVAAGATLGSIADLVVDVSDGKVTAVLALGTDTEVDRESLAPLGKLDAFVLVATHDGPLGQHANVTIPAASWAETEGTFVNAKGMSQTFKRALEPRGASLAAWDAIAQIGRAMKLDVTYKKFSDVRAALAARSAPAKSVTDAAAAPSVGA